MNHDPTDQHDEGSDDGAEPASHRREPLRVALAVLIALASVAAAVATYRLTRVSNSAAGNDGSTIDQTILQSRDESRANVIAQTERAAFVRYESERSAAASLEQLANEARQRGDLASEASLSNEAQSFDEAAKALSAQYPYIAEQATQNAQSAVATPTFDLAGRRRAVVLELERQRGELASDPKSPAASAGHDRRHAERLVWCVVLFALAIFVLALADQLGDRVVPLIAALAVLVLVGATITTVVLW